MTARKFTRRPKNEVLDESQPQEAAPAEESGDVESVVENAKTAGKKAKAKKPQKAGESPVVWDTAERAGFMSGLLADVISRESGSKKKIEGALPSYVFDPEKEQEVGMAMPSLSMEYLIGSNVYPFGRILQLAGPESTSKSTIMYDFFAMTVRNGGLGSLFETEHKKSPQLWADKIYVDGVARATFTQCSTVEAWQASLTQKISHYKKAFTGTQESPGPGPTIPVIFGIDSVAAALTKRKRDKVLKEGHASKEYSEESFLISAFLKATIPDLEDWPFSIVLVNHVGITKDDYGNDVFSTKGGIQLRYRATFEFMLQQIGKPKKFVNRKINTVKVTTTKNSSSEDYNSIFLPVVYWKERDPNFGNKLVGKSKVGWHEATISLLSNPPVHAATAVKKVGAVVDAGQGKYYCRAAGVPKTEAMSADDLAAHIMNHEVVHDFRDALRIREDEVFKSCNDYLMGRFGALYSA